MAEEFLNNENTEEQPDKGSEGIKEEIMYLPGIKCALEI